jgi:hypothetical protein
VAVTETVGGALLIAALATPLVAAALAIDMLVALLTARPGHGVFDRDGGFELLLGGASVAIGIVGGGPARAHARRGFRARAFQPRRVASAASPRHAASERCDPLVAGARPRPTPPAHRPARTPPVPRA